MIKKALFYFLGAFFLFCPVRVLSAAEISLTLDEAVALALRDNRDILLKSKDVEIAKAKINQARAGLFPELTAVGGWSDSRGVYDKDAAGFSASAGVKQVIYSGGKVLNSLKSGEHNYSAMEAVLDKTRQETIFNVKKSFYTLLLSVELLRVNKAIAANIQEHLDFIAARFSSGQASESEMITMRSSLSGAVQAYEAALNQAEAAGALLNNLLFLDQGAKIKAEGKFEYAPKEIAYDEAFLKALRLRPEIRQLEAGQNAAEAQVEIAKAGQRPQVSASWDYYSSSRLSTGTTKNWNDYNVLGISVSWPVFDGWLAKAKVEQALLDVQEARILKEKNIKDIALELKTVYLDLQNAVGKIKSISGQTMVYHDNLLVITDKYQAGIASGLALHDARLSYDIALFNQLQSYYDYVTAKAKFDNAAGGNYGS